MELLLYDSGLSIASGIGIQRSLYCLKDAELFCTPVDTSVRGIISSTWRKVLCEPKYVFNFIKITLT